RDHAGRQRLHPGPRHAGPRSLPVQRGRAGPHRSASSAMSLLLTDVTVGDRAGRAVHVVDGRIAWLGDAADAPVSDRAIAGEGALLTPAFVDVHVHTTATGLALTGLDLHSSSSLAETVALVARFA